MLGSQHRILQAATVTALLVAGPSLTTAQTQAQPSAASNAVDAVTAQGSALPASDALRERLEGLGERQLKAIYVECGRTATDRRLDSGEVQFCSVAYDILLRRHFAGDFAALHAWSAAAGD